MYLSLEQLLLYSIPIRAHAKVQIRSLEIHSLESYIFVVVVSSLRRLRPLLLLLLFLLYVWWAL